MKNQESIRAAYLAHMTPEEKKEYNKRYYQEHKEEYWGVKSGVDRFKSDLQRPHVTVTNDSTSGLQFVNTAGRKRNGKTVDSGLDAGYYARSDVNVPGWHKNSSGRNLDGSRIPTVQYQKIGQTNRRQSTPDLNTRTSAIQKPQQSANRLSTPGLNQRLASMKAYTTNSRRSTLSSIASSAVSKGKSIVSSFASAWKSGLSSLKSAFTPKTTSTLTTKRVSTTVTPAGNSGGYHFTLGPNGQTIVVRNK